MRTINQAMYLRGKYDAAHMGHSIKSLPILNVSEGFKQNEVLCYQAGWSDQIVGDDDNRRILSHTIDC